MRPERSVRSSERDLLLPAESVSSLISTIMVPNISWIERAITCSDSPHANFGEPRLAQDIQNTWHACPPAREPITRDENRTAMMPVK
jgi:hypothetical protein